MPKKVSVEQFLTNVMTVHSIVKIPSIIQRLEDEHTVELGKYDTVKAIIKSFASSGTVDRRYNINMLLEDLVELIPYARTYISSEGNVCIVNTITCPRTNGGV